MFQTKLNLTDLPKREYNGWTDWTTWNCALWINNEQGYMSVQKSAEITQNFSSTFTEFLIMMQHLMEQTGGRQT